MLSQAIREISADTMEQYERVRQSGVTDMYNVNGVMIAAEQEGFLDLLKAALDFDAYKLLLMNFQGLMRHYGVTQEARQ